MIYVYNSKLKKIKKESQKWLHTHFLYSENIFNLFKILKAFGVKA